MEKDKISRDFALAMIRWYKQCIITHIGFLHTYLDNLAIYASILYDTPLRAYINADSSIGFHCTDPSSPKYTDKDLTLDDIL